MFRMTMKLVAAGVLLCAAATAIVVHPAAARDHHGEPASAVVIEVEMRDHAFSPTPLRIPAGRTVTLVFENTGEVQHEFMAGRGVSEDAFDVDLFEGIDVVIENVDRPDHHDAPGAAPHDHTTDSHEHGGVGHGTMVDLDADRVATMTFTLPTDRRGEWVMACFLANHYERGMHGTLTVY